MNLAASIFGQVTAVRNYANGDLEVDFFHDDELATYRYSADPGRLGNFPKLLTEKLASTLTGDICVEIFFGDDGNPTHIELEKCDDDSEDDDEYDDDD